MGLLGLLCRWVGSSIGCLSLHFKNCVQLHQWLQPLWYPPCFTTSLEALTPGKDSQATVPTSTLEDMVSISLCIKAISEAITGASEGHTSIRISWTRIVARMKSRPPASLAWWRTILMAFTSPASGIAGWWSRMVSMRRCRISMSRSFSSMSVCCTTWRCLLAWAQSRQGCDIWWEETVSGNFSVLTLQFYSNGHGRYVQVRILMWCCEWW